MADAVADATVPIFLGKLGKLDLLQGEYDAVLIPETVRAEIVDSGKEKGAADAVLVEQAVEEGWVEVREVEPDPSVEGFGLAQGETDALALAEEEAIELLADEEAVREAARLRDVPVRGTVSFLLEEVGRGQVDFETYLKELDRLVDAGFYLSEDLYLKVVWQGWKAAEG